MARKLPPSLPPSLRCQPNDWDVLQKLRGQLATAPQQLARNTQQLARAAQQLASLCLEPLQPAQASQNRL